MKYNPFDKDLQDIQEIDLQKLIKNEIGEGWYIEYKREIPIKSTKLDNLKISKSVAAFANTNGGWIFWGIECDKNNKPINIKGIDTSKYSNFEDQISQIINSNITPNPIYYFATIKLSNNNIVLIIQVRESPTPPYLTSQGIIYQRENNESKPVRDRYILEKLSEKERDYVSAIESFTTFDLPETKGQGEWNQTYLELFLMPNPFNHFELKNFYTSDFFRMMAVIFYQHVDVQVDINDFNAKIPLNLGFNSIFSSEGSLIIRPLTEENLIYKSTTVELFDNGNLKFLIPLNEFGVKNIPDKYKESETINYLLDKYTPLQIIEQPNFRGSSFGFNSDTKLPPIETRSESGFGNHVKFIDGMNIILIMLIMISKYKAILEYGGFDFINKIGFRARITDCWRKFIFFDDDDYLEKIKLYNIPLSAKNEIEIPEFKNGKSYKMDLLESTGFFSIAKFIIEGIGIPDSQSINYIEIMKRELEKIKTNNNSG